MKKTFMIFSIAAICSITPLAMADSDGLVNGSRLIQAPTTLPENLPEVTEIQDLPDFNPVKSTTYTTNMTTNQNAKLQDALLKIDSAQINVKNELNLYESKLIDVKNRENLVKQERKGVQKEIRLIKKKMNSLDNAKKQINKTMADKIQTNGNHFNWFK